MTQTTEPNLPRWEGWRHTHTIDYRMRPFPVMARVVDGAVMMFRTDGLIEWIKLPGRAGWLFRGMLIGSGVGVRTNPGSSIEELQPGYHHPVDALPENLGAEGE